MGGIDSSRLLNQIRGSLASQTNCQCQYSQNFDSNSRNLLSSSHCAAAFSLPSRKLLQDIAGFAPPRVCPLHSADGVLNTSADAQRLAPGRKLCSMPVRAS